MLSSYCAEIKKLDYYQAEDLIINSLPEFEHPFSLDKDVSMMVQKWSQFAKFLLIKNAEDIAAIIVFYENQTGKFLYIPHLVVMGKHRHAGVGHYALDFLVHQFIGTYEVIRLEVRQDNSNAIKFYEREGFSCVEIRTETYLMEKKLI